MELQIKIMTFLQNSLKDWLNKNLLKKISKIYGL